MNDIDAMNVVEAIDRDQLLDDVMRLIEQPSENPGGTEAATVDVLEIIAREFGARVERRRVAPGRENIALQIGPKTGAPLVFLGHSDVVPAGAGWSADPFTPRILGDRLIGRGSTDMKGGLAAVLAAMRALRAVDLERPVELFVTVDEEDRATGMLAQMSHPETSAPYAVIVAEPTDLDVVVACRGAANFELEFLGKSAHAGRPDDGASAVIAGARTVELLAADHAAHRASAEDPDWAPTWNVGTIAGGHGTSIVADRCTLGIDRRLMPGEDPQAALDWLLQAIREEGILPQGVTVRGRIDMAMPGFETSPDAPLAVTALEKALLEGAHSTLTRWTAACEGGFLATTFGCPTIILGPGEIRTQAHQPDESVSITDLHRAARIFTQLALELAGVQADPNATPLKGTGL